MSKKTICLITVLFLLFSIFGVCASAEGSLDFSTLKSRYYEYYLDNVNINQTMEYLESQLDDGTWDDIDYSSQANKTENEFKHLERLRSIVSLANKKGTVLYYSKPKAISAVENGLRAFQEKYPLVLQENGYLITTSSWWNDTIGVQLHYMIPIAITGDEWISEVSKNIIYQYLVNDIDIRNYPTFLTGANLVWYLHSGAIEAICREDAEEFERCYKKMISLVKITTYPYEEGIKNDNSFQQHGPDYYTTYGTNFFLNILIHTKMIQGTSLEEPSIYPVLANALLDGDRWLYYGNEQTPLVTGKDISSESIGTGIVQELKLMAEIYPDKREELLDFATHVENNDRTHTLVSGNKHFWCSDIMAHKRDGYSIITRLSSERTRSTESNVNQNYLGAYVGYGMLLLTNSNSSQNQDRVLWDWGHLPGVTGPSTVYKIKNSGTFLMQNEKFVGGVSDGTYGATAMKLNKWNTIANKSYFFFDDCYVALGSGISTARQDVSTTIDQRRLYGDLLINGVPYYGSDKAVSDVRTVYNNSIGYYFPNTEDINVFANKVSGKWSDIVYNGSDITQEADMYKLYKPHNSEKRNDTYSYIVLPNTTNEQLEAFSSNPYIDIIENTKNVQAVFNSNENVGYVVFYNSGSCRLNDGLSISVNYPCIVMIRLSSGKYSVSISEPTGSYNKIRVKLDLNGNVIKKAFDMPINNSTAQVTGKTVTNEF